MKALKIIAALSFMIGFMLVAGAIGTDDFYTMELHQQHALQLTHVIIGLLMCLPVVLISKVNDYD